MTEFKDNIIKKITQGEVTMQPRWHFVLRTLLFVALLCIVATLAMYFLSFAVFALQKTGVLFAPGFGFRGIGFFLWSSPWFLISLTGIFLLLLYILIKHFSFSYKRPLLYSMLAVILFVICTASLIHHFAMHDRFLSFTERNNLPGFTPLYHRFEKRPEGMIAGTVTQIQDTGFVVITDTKEVLTIVVTQDTKVPPQVEFKEGDMVFVFGDRHEDVLTAFGIKPVPSDLPPRKGGLRMHQ